jgi:hypothetical protein
MANLSSYIQLFGVGLTICIALASYRYGWDIHIWDLTAAQLVASRQVSFAAQALFIPATGLAKISILASYVSRLAPPETWFRRFSSKSFYPRSIRVYAESLTGYKVVGIWATALANLAIFVALFSECR